MGDELFIKVGHVGIANGDAWDEKGHHKIVRIFIWHGSDAGINSIQFQYAVNGNLVLSDRHGKSDGCKFDLVKLNYPAEYITWISGHRTTLNCNAWSVKFGTNLGEYGPYGKSTCEGQEFIFRLGEDHQFGGFYGTADSYDVKSIGVYLKHITTLDCPDYRKGKSVRKTEKSWRI